MTDQMLKREIQTVGTWYFCTFIDAVLTHYEALQDRTTKKEFVYKLQKTVVDGEVSLPSTVSKVNAMLRIIHAHAVVRALQLILRDTNPQKVVPDTIECARAVLTAIETGRLQLPRI